MTDFRGGTASIKVFSTDAVHFVHHILLFYSGQSRGMRDWTPAFDRLPHNEVDRVAATGVDSGLRNFLFAGASESNNYGLHLIGEFLAE